MDVLDREVTHNGSRKPLSAHLASAPVPMEVAILRLSAGWPLERILTEPQRPLPKQGQRKSRWRGLTWHERNKQWYVRVKANGELQDVGYFHDELEAATAYNWAARRVHGGAAMVNVM